MTGPERQAMGKRYSPTSAWATQSTLLDTTKFSLSPDYAVKQFKVAERNLDILSGEAQSIEIEKMKAEIAKLKTETLTLEALQEIQKQINEAIAEGLKTGKAPKIKVWTPVEKQSTVLVGKSNERVFRDLRRSQPRQSHLKRTCELGKLYLRLYSELRQALERFAQKRLLAQRLGNA